MSVDLGLQPARLVAFREAVRQAISTAMPKLGSCEVQTGRFNLDDLVTQSVRTPAVRFAVIKAPFSNEANASITATCQCAAYAITEGRNRDETAWTIGEAIAALAHSGQQWGLTNIGVPMNSAIEPVVALKIERRTTAIVAVTWTQRLLAIGTTFFESGDPVVPTELYIGDEAVDITEILAEASGGQGGGSA